MRGALAALGLAAVLAPLALAYPTPVGEVHPALFLDGGGAATVLLSTGAWTASPGEFHCPGATYDILVLFASAGDQGVAAVLSDGRDADCSEAWPPMLLRGAWGTGWVGECAPLVGICAELGLGPSVPGQPIGISLDGGNGVRRTGTLDPPQP